MAEQQQQQQLFNRLSRGSMHQICVNREVNLKPVVQLLELKVLSGGEHRVRAMISDGELMNRFVLMIDDKLWSMYQMGQLEKFTIVRVENYKMTNANNGKMVLLISDVVPLVPGAQVKVKLGNPKFMDDISSGSGVTGPGTGAPVGAGAAQQPQAQGKLVNKSTTRDFVVREYQPNAPTSGGNASVNAQSGSFYGNNNNSVNSLFTNSPPTAGVGAGNAASNVKIVIPIRDITPYQSRWAIKGRVTSKTPVRTWSNAKGEGKLFSFDVCDESGEIRITAFKAECDRFFDMILPDKVYLISRGSVKTANKKFTNLNNDYEISLIGDSTIDLCDESQCAEVPQIKYNFIPISEIENKEVHSFVDVIGICKSVGDLGKITAKSTGKENSKRDIQLVDHSGYEIRLTVWGKDAEEMRVDPSSVLTLRNARVGEFQGKNLSTVGSTLIDIDPDIPEAHRLRGWFDQQGKSLNYRTLSGMGGGVSRDPRWHYYSDITPRAISNAKDNQLYFTNKGIIIMSGKNPLYRSCGNNGCMKKVIDMNNGYFRCDKCGSDNDQFQWRIVLSLHIADCTGDAWITLFQEEGEKLLGVNAQEWGRNFEERGQSELTKVLNQIHFKPLIMKSRAKVETYKDVSRIKSTVLKARPVDTVGYSKRLLKEIRCLTNSAQN